MQYSVDLKSFISAKRFNSSNSSGLSPCSTLHRTFSFDNDDLQQQTCDEVSKCWTDIFTSCTQREVVFLEFL